MAANVEIKAKATDWDAQLSRAQALCDNREEFTQEDTFFPCARGRLKLRVLRDRSRSYLIYYERADQQGPKSSLYRTAPVPDPGPMKDLLAQACGRGRVVRKKRTLLLVGQTRVHFDEVEGLGRFIELEVCLRPEQTPQEGESIARDLMARIGIEDSALLQGAYADMLPDGSQPK